MLCLIHSGQLVVYFIQCYKRLNSRKAGHCKQQPIVLTKLPVLATCVSEHNGKCNQLQQLFQ